MRAVFPPFVSLVIALWVTSCGPARTPVPPGMIPEEPPVSEQQSLEGRQLKEALRQQFTESDNPAYRFRVRRVMDRLLAAAGASQPWHISILEDDGVVNAAATQGNHIFIWTGALRSLRDDGELAAVLGHEIAHVLARHVEPQFADDVNRGFGGLGDSGSEGIFAPIEEAIAGIGNSSGSTAAVKGVVVTPYSQELELEADHIGMFLMAEAGYNPELALNFWRRSAAEAEESSAFLSTHPNSRSRLLALQALLPRAVHRYQQS
ncbi:MAG: M48 family metallopeptidase, partial [Bdellovibrionales bacterium]|nr:M48 family metallopeptidase [Bdellovibrionales bacterium]